MEGRGACLYHLHLHLHTLAHFFLPFFFVYTTIHTCTIPYIEIPNYYIAGLEGRLVGLVGHEEEKEARMGMGMGGKDGDEMGDGQRAGGKSCWGPVVYFFTLHFTSFLLYMSKGRLTLPYLEVLIPLHVTFFFILLVVCLESFKIPFTFESSIYLIVYLT